MANLTTATVIFERHTEEECWFACTDALTISNLMMQVRKSFPSHKKKCAMLIFDANGHRVSASSYHRARKHEMTIRIKKIQ